MKSNQERQSYLFGSLRRSLQDDFDPIDMKVDHFSNEKDKKSGYTVTLKTEANENIRWRENFVSIRFLTEGNLEIKSVPSEVFAYTVNVCFLT